MSESEQGAPRGVPDPLAPIGDILNLTGAGKVWRSLASIWAEDPDDLHPTVGQILARAARLAIEVCVRTVQRGLKVLAAIGRIRVEPDPSHPVGRRISPTGPVGVTTLSGGDTHGMTEVSPPYVLREGIESLHVERNPEGGDSPVAPPSGPLTHTLGHLEANPLALEGCVAALAREFGDGFVPFYRKTCRQVLGGQLPIGDLIGAVEEANGPAIKHRGRSFTRSIKRRLAEYADRLATRTAPAPPLPPPPAPATAEPEAPAPPAVADREATGAIVEPIRVAPVVADPAPAVEVLPTDEEVRFHIDMLGATDDAMFVLAVRTLRLCGRGDLVGPREVARFERVREAMKARLVGGPAPGAARRGRMSGVFPRRPGPEREPAGRALASPPAGT